MSIEIVKDGDVARLKLDSESVTEEQLKNWRENSEKLSGYEKTFSLRMEELSNKEKSVEPLLELRTFLEANPDKSEEIARILEGREPEPKKSDFSNVDKPLIGNQKIEKELEDVKQILSEEQKNRESERRIRERAEYEIKSKEAQEFLLKETNDLRKDFPFLAPEVLWARLLNTKDIDKMSQDNIKTIMKVEAKSINDNIFSGFESKHKEYLEQKRADAMKSKTESKVGGIGKNEKEEIKHQLSDGSTKAEALRMLKELTES